MLTITGILASHPFHVISVRMMAQFIGHEKYYNSILGAIAEIYQNDGIQGFFAGILPKIIGDITCLILASSTVFIVNKYLIHDKCGRQYSAGVVQVNNNK